MKEPENHLAAAFPELSPQEVRRLEDDLLDAARRAGLAGEIVSARRSPLDSTSYRTEIVTVDLDSGLHLKCFLKDFGSYARDKGQMAARRDRERFLYKDVFGNGELGPPGYVTDVWSDRITWLVLEFVDGVPLAWCDLEVWYEAAAWLGRWQTAIAGWLPALRRSGHFVDRDPAYFAGIAAKARAGAERVDEGVAQQVAAALPAYLAGSETLTRQPQTIVHGAFRPNQILVESRQATARICPIDWEIAAIGSCLYDLAALADGFEGARLETFMARYLAEATWLESPPTVSELRSALTTCRNHRALKWIAQGPKRGFSHDDVRELAASLTESAPELQK